MSSIPLLDSPANRNQLNRVLSNWKMTPATFAYKLSRKTWIPAKHLMYISSVVAKGIAQGNARIIISAPPRHGKSELTSVYTPTWALENYPDRNVIMATYGADLSIGFSRRVRDMIMDPNNKELLNTTIRRDASRTQAFLTPEGGGMYAVGLGGPITGRGADILLIDDYIKEIKEALSPAYRDYIWNWWVTTAYTRLEPGGSVIIIATRWHSDDLIGRIVQNEGTTQNGGRWTYIEIPAICDVPEDFLGRKLGDPLFPERYPIERLRELEESLGGVFFGALFQQKPVDETKRLANRAWLKPITELPNRHELVHWKHARIWDLAATEGGGDYTVGTEMYYHPQTEQTIIANVIRDQWSPGQVETKVQETAIADGLDCDVYIEQEPGSAGKALIDHYQKTVLPEFRVIAVPAVNNKVVRAQPLLAAAEAGKVSYITGHWNEAFLAEFHDFPGTFDDQVDTASAGYARLSGKKIYSAAWGRTSKSTTANSNAIKRAQFAAGSGSRVRGATFGRR